MMMRFFQCDGCFDVFVVSYDPFFSQRSNYSSPAPKRLYFKDSFVNVFFCFHSFLFFRRLYVCILFISCMRLSFRMVNKVLFDLV